MEVPLRQDVRSIDYLIKTAFSGLLGSGQGPFESMEFGSASSQVVRKYKRDRSPRIFLGLSLKRCGVLSRFSPGPCLVMFLALVVQLKCREQ